ncbi:hypothetical protein ACJX0J_037743 [Zea mays]
MCLEKKVSNSIFDNPHIFGLIQHPKSVKEDDVQFCYVLIFFTPIKRKEKQKVKKHSFVNIFESFLASFTLHDIHIISLVVYPIMPNHLQDTILKREDYKIENEIF